MGGRFQANAGPSFDHLLKKHPCFGGEAHFKYGRIHLPVSSSCNIQCKFCKRSFNKCEQRPGAANSILSPTKALEILERALQLCPDITVAGIAGPGDTLATPHALATFELIHSRYPHLINCLSTNGLLLEEKAEQIIAAGVKTVTVTVNSVRAEISQHICSYIVYRGQYMTGKEAARTLIEAQLAGIKKISALGIVVKINTVLIPGINDGHVAEVARTTAVSGATTINIIPLIPQHEMETYRPPNCSELQTAREAAEEHMPVFRHCRQCRADACGIPGQGIDLAGLLYEQPLQTFSHG